MELSYKEEVSVGVMVIAGLVVFTIGMFWLTGRSLTSSGVTVRAEFANVKGLKEGDPVRVSGVKKGRVQQVQLQRVGRVAVTLQLSPDVRPHRDATATVAAADFLGAMYVAYDPGAAPELLAEGKPIPGVTEEQFSDVAAGAATSAKELIENVNKGLNPGQLASDIHATLIATQRGMKALTDAANGPTVKQTQQTLAALERVMVRLDTLLGAAHPTTTAKRLDTLSVNLAQPTNRLSDATGAHKRLLDEMDRGEGTIGKVATDTMLYKNLRSEERRVGKECRTRWAPKNYKK